MALNVSDSLSNSNDQIANAATLLRNSEKIRSVFTAIYKGGKKPKSVKVLQCLTGLSQVEVSQQAAKLHSHNIVDKTKLEGTICYQKVAFINTNKGKILNYAIKPKSLEKLPTKVNPAVKFPSNLKINVASIKFQAKQITCSDIDQFSAVSKVREVKRINLSETEFKEGIKRIIGEKGTFKDWGGEANDLYSTNISMKNKRLAIAFAFKGPGMKGNLTPGKLGKNGDQIQRLMDSPAQVFFVQYHDKIEQSVVAQMHTYAMLNSATKAKKIYYGIIDGNDTDKIVAAFPKAFKKAKK